MRPHTVNIVEVGPRDGLQHEAQVDLASRIQLVNALSGTGLTHIEVGSFVSEKWLPQMAGTEQVFAQIQRLPNIRYAALTPNLIGFEHAIAANVDEVAVFTAASEPFCQRNIHCSIAQSLQRFEPIMLAAQNAHIPVRGYVSCVLGCPEQGAVAPEQVASVAQALFELGCEQISLGDTIGVGTAMQAQTLCQTVAKCVPLSALALHFHDTYGQALANVLACLELGINTFDSAVAGLGGCPYAQGASGNLATEDLIYWLDGLGIEHGVDLKALIAAGEAICQQLGRTNGSKVARALTAKQSG